MVYFRICIESPLTKSQLFKDKWWGNVARFYPPPGRIGLATNPRHYSNTGELIKIIEEIISQRVKSQCEGSKISPDTPALLIMNVFRGQMTSKVMDFLKKENILTRCVPSNTTHIFQPLDLPGKSWAKNVTKEKFTTL